MSFGAVSSACWRIRKLFASETLGSSTLWSPLAWGLGEAGSVYTCHEGGGGRKRKPEQSPKLLNKLPGGSGRCGAEGRWKRRGRGSQRRPGTWEKLSLRRPVPGRASPPAPLSMGFSRQEYWSGLPFPSPGDLPDPGIKSGSPALQADSLPSEPPEVK